MERHHGIIRAYLARQATWVGSRPLWEELQRQGEVMPYSRAQKLVQRLAARGELARRGERHYTQYQMKPHTKKKPPSKPPHTHPRASADGHKTAIIVGLVRDAKGPVTIKELVPLARAAGVASLTGMYNYVTQGYLRKAKKNGHRAYAFVAMPPAPPAPSSSSAS
jgi:hypothetical protein